MESVSSQSNAYDVIVVGGGHAGCEAALASARMGARTLLLTHNLDTIGHMSCNPAIGGLAKGHLVREIDALGGEMGRNADYAGIQFRRLNMTKGPAVRATRAQCDRNHYKMRMKEVIDRCPNLHTKQASVEDLLIESHRVVGVVTQFGQTIRAATVVLTTGTFLNGLMHYGQRHYDGGRAGDAVARGISKTLLDAGFRLGRLKTGTVPRVDGRSIDFTNLERQDGDMPAPAFSFFAPAHPLPQVPCFVTYTNPKTHAIIRAHLHESPMYSGKIEGIGPRYCPSIEDKVVRFADKDRHQIFLEPEGLNTQEIYVNGVSTSLPVEVQIEALRSIAGLEQVEVMRPGYAVEYDFILPQQLFPSLETKLIAGLFHAGQINGTSGYEEAAAQGLMAGINAACLAKGRASVVLDRAQAYIGVLIDDLVTKGTEEPYRMFTSRAEYRLLLREDNADLRLCELGNRLGLLSPEDFAQFSAKQAQLDELLAACESNIITPTAPVNEWLITQGSQPLKKATKASVLARRPELALINILKLLKLENLEPTVVEQAEINFQYAGYIEMQEESVQQMRNYESIQISATIDYATVPSLSNEVRLKLTAVRPTTIGQAARISGVTPAAISILMIHLKSQAA